MEQTSSPACTRCGAAVTGNFCSNCGTPTAATTRGEHIQEVSSEVAGVDILKAWRTIRDLTLKPGAVVLAYVTGNREKYLSPIAYCLFVFTLSIAIDSVTGINRYIMSRTDVSWAGLDQGAGQPNTVAVSRVQETMLDFVNSKSGQMLLLIPSILLFQWLLFRKYRKSFAENVYFALFTTSHYILLILPLTALFFVDKEVFYYLYLVAGIVAPPVYMAWAGIIFYRQKFGPLIGRNIVLEVLNLVGVALTTTVISMVMAGIVLD
jgi:hypothetical protein